MKANPVRIRQLKANEGDSAEVLNARMKYAQAISGGYDFADTLHNIYMDFGYPSALQFSNFWNMYRRFGIAKNICDLPVDITWSEQPEIVGSDDFNNELNTLIDKTSLFVRLKGLDHRQRVGRYAGLFMRIRDGKAPHEPVEIPLSGPASIMQMIPLYEGQLKVLTTDTDPKSDTYGEPTMYQFGSGAGNRDEKEQASFSIHPDRVVITAEGADNGSIYGIPTLEACYNSLMDLRKIIGAGGEGFYKNAAQNIVFTLKDAASAAHNADLLQKFNDKYDDFSQNRQRRGLWTPGLEANALESSLVQPRQFFDIALNDVSACAKIPATIIIGQQTGRLASNEDSRSFLSGVNSRRENYGSELISSVIDWCQKYGVLPMSDYDIKWSDLLAQSNTEKLESAEKMARINDLQFKSAGALPFAGEEIREAGGFEPAEDIIPEGEGDGEED